jgi:hypothetical protein
MPVEKIEAYQEKMVSCCKISGPAKKNAKIVITINTIQGRMEVMIRNGPKKRWLATKADQEVMKVVSGKCNLKHPG